MKTGWYVSSRFHNSFKRSQRVLIEKLHIYIYIYYLALEELEKPLLQQPYLLWPFFHLCQVKQSHSFQATCRSSISSTLRFARAYDDIECI